MTDYSQLYPWISNADISQPTQSLGIFGSSIQGPLEVTAQMGKHADWEKFLNEARRSTNIEDNRAAGEALQRKLANEPLWQQILRGMMPGSVIDDYVDRMMYK